MSNPADQRKPGQPDYGPVLELLTKMQRPDELNGMVVLHFDPITRRLKSISPALPVQSLAQLIDQLGEAGDAILKLREDLVNKSLKGGGQAN